MNIKNYFYIFCLPLLLLYSCKQVSSVSEKTPVDYVNPYMGNISHLLVPTYPTIQLPNSMLRVYPERADFTSIKMKGLPIMMTSHRGKSAFNLSAVQTEANDSIPRVMYYEYDNEVIKPYLYQTHLLNEEIDVKFAPSHQSGIYQLKFEKKVPPYILLSSNNGQLTVKDNIISGFQQIKNSSTKVFIHLEVQENPEIAGAIIKGKMDYKQQTAEGYNATVGMAFPKDTKYVSIRYGISFISTEQAMKNWYREIKNYDLNQIAEYGKRIWNEKLGKIEVSGTSEETKNVFYTSLYRTYERMVCISEDNKFWSAFDNSVHNDSGVPFYTDDWIWDTYRACHPLRVLIEPKMETDMIRSFIRMAEQMDNFWMPTFPEITGDSRRMNSNHGVATIIDSYVKGLRDFNIEKAYYACKNAITEKTLAPWSAQKAGKLDLFYKENGYMPALRPGEKEIIPEVHSFEKRQPVAVTLGTVYDEWCLSQIAFQLNKKEDYKYFSQRSLSYHKLFNPQTKFFHPKDDRGNFITPFNYTTSGGLGAREAYGENNGWVYRWDVPHNIADLINLMGGKNEFVNELDSTFSTPLGISKYIFYAQLPDHTGNVGMYSMANEPSLHIPYLYNYAGQPWKTQKSIRTLIDQWFRNDLMGVPGDEDGGGMSAFVVFSTLGFYPVTPGLPMYVIGSPFFEKAIIHLGNGKTFKVIAINNSKTNKYIQSAKLNGKVWNKSWISHKDVIKGGILELTMGNKPNRNWASADEDIPPSFEMYHP